MTAHPGRVRRTSIRLADGRELIYFDDPYGPAGDRSAPDTRDLPPRPPGSTARLDPLTGDWVTLAPHRMERTADRHTSGQGLPGDGTSDQGSGPSPGCPLCPSRPGASTEIPAADYHVVVFENRFPPFATARPPAPDGGWVDGGFVDGEALWPERPAAGRAELICFTSAHAASFAELSPERVATVLHAWADRTATLSASGPVRQVFCFENRGADTGATLHHPHGQIYGLPFLAPRTERMLARVAEHRRRGGADLIGDLLAAERRAGTRVVHEGEEWTAFVPAAARWPVELHLVPHRAVPDFAALDGAQRAELAVLYPALLRRVDRYFADQGHPGPVPYVAGWHQAPAGQGRDLLRLHLQLFSVRRGAEKLKYLAGSESGLGAWLSDTTPERIARRFREVG